MNPKYLVTDVETGGFEGTSLLTAYFAILNEQLNIVNDLYLFVKPNDGIYHIDPQAMVVNKIDLITHDAKAITYKEAGQKLYAFLDANTNGGEFKPQPLGHNVYFDIDRIKADLISPGSWGKMVSYRLIDTGVVGSFLKDSGKIPSDISGSLGSYCQYFGIDTQRAHDAQGDCVMVMNLYRKMKELIGKNQA